MEPLRAIVAEFCAEPVAQIAPLGHGHIHQTYLVRFSGGAPPLVLQRVNTVVFSKLDGVMENIARVTSHLRARLTSEGAELLEQRILALLPTRAGETQHVDARLGPFRAFAYVDGSVTLRRLQAPEEAFEAGRACGEFARLLDDLPPERLHTTLPDFHATHRRFDVLRAAIAADHMDRVKDVWCEWREIERLEPLARECSQWAHDPELRLRITHNDTKLDNILFDARTHKALCLIDLDTVMPGYLAYDFGDLVRSCLCSVDEDARDAGRLQLRFEWYEPLVRGYLSELRDLNALERRSLARGPLWIVLELAIRFLTDHIEGDRYFKTERAGHNLDRTRVMLTLLARFLERESELLDVIEACAAKQ